MIINCTYDKTLYRDEKLGDTKFTVIPQFRGDNLSEYGNIVCSGIIPNYPKGMPLEINLIKDNSDIYKVWNIKVSAYDKRSVYDFLISGYFAGIGPVKAEEYINSYGFHIFDNERVDKFSVIYEKTRSFLAFEKLLQTVYAFGGDYHNAYRLFKKYGNDCYEILKNNPYEMFGTIPFNLIDKYALKNGFDRFDKKRVKAVISEGLRIMEARGDTCLDTEAFCKIIEKIDKDINPLYILGEVLNEKEFYFKEETFSIYDSQLFMCEENITFNISRAQANKISLGEIRKDVIKEIEKEENIQYGANQLEVFTLLRETGIKIITGGPGTGKTTAINALIKYIRKVFPDKTIVMAAPTANAAKRMREKTGENATTIHKLLEIKPFADSLNFGFKNIADDFIIIDECSFIDTRLASIIFQSIKTDATVILVGDIDQLPSVASGNVFRDLIESETLPVVKLEKIFRQSGNSSIIENAYKIKMGDTSLYTDEDFSVVRFANEESLFEQAVAFVKDNYDKDNPYSVRLYTPVRKRKYLTCTHNFNKRLQEFFSNKEEVFVYGYTRFYVGDPVIFTRNNYPAGYANGDEGRIVRILQNDSGKYGVMVVIDNVTLEIKGDNLLDMELSFAITTHKSQGSECDTALVIVPASPKGMLDRSLVYVATTRARKRTIVFTEGDSINKAIINDRKKERTTGLKAALIRQMPSFPHNKK